MTLRLARYGAGEVLLFSAVVAVAAVLATVYFVPALPVVLGLWALVLYFFRDPKRLVPQGEDLLVAPADGKVVRVERIRTPGEDRAFWQVDIFLSIFDVHINRAPCRGTVESLAYRRGKFLNALRAEAGERNESNEVSLRTPLGVPVRVRQIAGAIARRIVCDCRVGDRLLAGEPFGMIKFGSRTQLTVPEDAVASLAVGVGQRVRAGQTIIGKLR